MPVVIILLAVIVVVLLFGPIGAGLFALATASLGALLAAIVAVIIGAVAGVYVLGTLIWVIWWVFDPRAAMREFRGENR